EDGIRYRTVTGVQTCALPIYRIRTDNPPPRLAAPTPEQAMRFVEADFRLRDAEKTLQDRNNELGETQEKWERETNAKPPPKPNEDRKSVVKGKSVELSRRGTK